MFLVLNVMNDYKLKMNLKHHISIPKPDISTLWGISLVPRVRFTIARARAKKGPQL